MIGLIREKFPIFILIMACCLLLFLGKTFYDHQFTTTKYKGVVVEKTYEQPTSGYRSQTKILNDIKFKFLKETMVDEVWKLNNGYCEDIADYFIDIIGGETQDTYIIDDGWFWDSDKISNLETKTGEYWNVKNLKKYGEPPFGWENLNKLDLHGHVWVFSKGKHYDVETLNGVENFWDLPIYKRQLKSVGFFF